MLIVPEGEITTPLGLIKKIFPLEFSCPAIVEGVDPVTLFKEAEEEEGILKSTRPCLWIEKEFQFIIDLLVLWSIVR